MSVAFNAATAMNVSILSSVNRDFQTAQKRVSSGKNVFGAADDATRYRMSQTMLTRSNALDSLNNNISLALKSLETTDKTLTQIISQVNAAQDLVRKAQAEGAATIRGIQSGVNISSSTNVTGITVGSQLSVTSDAGSNFTYTATSTATTWGMIADALNSANIGVQAVFVPSTTAGQTNIQFKSTNGKDFKFDGVSAQVIMDDLANASMVSPSGSSSMISAAQANFLFGPGGGSAPAASEVGFTVTFGGAVVGAKNITGATAVASGSTLVFEDGNGATRSYVASTSATNVTAMMAEFNGLFRASGVLLELSNSGAAANTTLRLRNTEGGNMRIFAATADFLSTGTTGLTSAAGTAQGYAAPLSSNNTLRLQYGVQFDAIVTNINALIANNPVSAGRNLLSGQNLNVVMDEFAGNPITITGANISGAGSTNNAIGFVAVGAGNTWTTDAAIQSAATNSNQALTVLRDLQSNLATFNSYMQSRYDMNKSYGTDMKTIGDDLVAADVSEESARLSALQTQQQFAVQAFSMGTQNAQGLLRLLS